MHRRLSFQCIVAVGSLVQVCVGGVDMNEYSEKNLKYNHCKDDSWCGSGEGVVCEGSICGCKIGFYHIKKPIPDFDLECAKQFELGDKCVFNKECMPPLRCISGSCFCPQKRDSHNSSIECLEPPRSVKKEDSESLSQGISMLLQSLLVFWVILLTFLLVCCFCRKQRPRKMWVMRSSFGFGSSDSLLSPNEHIINEYGKPDDGMMEAAATQSLYTRMMMPLPSYEAVSGGLPSYEEAALDVI